MIAQRVIASAGIRIGGREKRPAAPVPEPAVASGAACPECGGSISVNDGDRSVRCGYCGSALYVAAPRGVQSFILRPKITPAKARLAAIRYIAEKTNNRLRTRHASIADLKLIHVPFWRLRGRLMGWVSGERTALVKVETVSDDPGGASQTRATVREEHTPYSRLVFKRVDWSAPACVLPCLGLQGISLRTGFLDWDVLDDRKRSEHTIALPVRSERRVRRDALSYLKRLAVPAGTTVRASRFHFFDSRLSLYYYPVYLLRYGCAGRLYTITIDAGSGAVVRGDVPRKKRLEPKKLFFAPAALAFLAATWLPLVLIPVCVLYALDTARAKLFLPPHEWLAFRINGILESEN
jgi:ribosomal protein S27AE